MSNPAGEETAGEFLPRRVVGAAGPFALVVLAVDELLPAGSSAYPLPLLADVPSGLKRELATIPSLKTSFAFVV